MDIIKDNIFLKSFVGFGGPFQFSNQLQLLNNQSCQVSSVLKRRIKNDKYQLLKSDRSRYIVISLKSQKGLELVSSLQH